MLALQAQATLLHLALALNLLPRLISPFQETLHRSQPCLQEQQLKVQNILFRVLQKEKQDDHWEEE